MFIVYKHALKRFFGRLRWLGERVPVVYAGPDRAHGQLLEYMAHVRASNTGKSIDEVKLEFEEGALPRPFISVFMTMAGYDQNRFSPFIHRMIEIDRTEGTALSVAEPRPENFTVQADIWCGDDWALADDLVFQLKSMFVADDTPLFVDFTDARWYKPPYQVPEFCKYMGKITCRMTDDGVQDASEYTGGVGTPKEIRKTFSGTLYAWIPRVPFKGKLVHSLEFDLKASDGTEVEELDDFTIDFPQ
jgi:hypothetical protein